MKLKQKTKDRIRGSVTVLLVLILLPMMTFSALIVDMSRVNMAKEMMSSAGDLAMNTALANYDTILKDVYGLFAMSQDKSNEELAEDLQDYFEKTLVDYGAIEEEYAEDYVAALMGSFHELLSGNYGVETTNFLELSDIKANASKVETSGLNNPDILRKQLVEYMKYRAPLNLGMSFFDSLKSFKSVSAQNDVVETQVKVQESTQDVTQACSKLIKLIREYDKLVVEIDSGASAVKGKNSSGDGVVVPIADYDTQVDKYRETWADNYAHINKLNLVFQANPPSINGKYLKGMDYSGGVRFVKANGAGLTTSGSGISVSVNNLASDYEAADRQVTNQINNLNSNHKPTANAYEAKNFMNSSLLRNDYSSFTDEGAAITTFIEFEKFLLNKLGNGEPNYSAVAKTLEEIYKLKKYYDNYSGLISEEIDKQKDEVQQARNTLNSKTANRDNAIATMKSAVTQLNSLTKPYRDTPGKLACLAKIETVLLYGNVRTVLQALPTLSGGYTSYNTNNLSAGESSSKYLTAYYKITDNENFDANLRKVAKAYIPAVTNKTLANYIKDSKSPKVDAKVIEENTDLINLLTTLYSCHKKALSYKTALDKYNKAVSEIPAAERALAAAESTLAAREADRNNRLSKYNTCLNGFYNFGAAYQADLYYYTKFIQTAQNMIKREAEPIRTQFTQIQNNVNSLRTKLDAISKQIVNVKTAIATYETNIGNWETANNNYASQNGSDSFSKQTQADIKAARSEYDPKGFDTLDEFVISLWNEFDDLYTRLTDSTHFKYGNTKIKSITTAKNVLDAVRGTTLSAVVTEDEAADRFVWLYVSDKTPECVPYTVPENEQLCFLTPTVLPIKILKYLNGAYPETAPAGSEGTKAEYEAEKNKLVGNSTEEEDTSSSGSGSGGSGSGDGTSSGGQGEGGDKNTVTTDKYGYTYASRTLSGEGLPSDKSERKELKESQLKIKETEKDGNKSLNASSGVSAQSSVLDTILNGIGDAVSAGIENGYILSYVFENFSYNTMVQEAIVEANDITLYSEAKTAVGNADNIKNVKDALKTLSGYKKSSANNYLNGAEVEYIMYGSLTPKSNVSSAKASIYGIRFAFNCIYALTNSEIRNMTMAAGLAVQAATMGIVPYQVVQIVLQLALAAAETAVDLDKMACGLKVAIVKTTETWVLSPRGAANSVKGILEKAAEDATKKAINNVGNGLQSLVDAGADELNQAIEDVSSQLETASKKVVNDFVDQAFAEVMGQIEEGLNSLQFGAETKDAVQAKSDQMFQGIRNRLHNTLSNLCGGNELAMKALPTVESYASDLIGAVQTKVDAALASANADNVLQVVAEQMNSIKNSMITKAADLIDDVIGEVNQIAYDTVSGVQNKLNGIIGDKTAELSEEAAAQVKDAVSDAVNDYIGDYVDVGNNSAIGGGSTSSNVASMIKFGYKDYLMLFTYISICVNDDNVLTRTADMIQLNLQNANGTALGEFKHKKGSGFKMSDAKTYVTLDADAQLDMFFLDLDLFANFLQGEGEEVEENKEAASKIHYKGLLGY